MSLLTIKNASTGYGNKQVLFDVSLDVEQGDTVLLIGSNGSGKSTLLKLVYGLMDVWQGTVEYNGKLLHSTSMKTPTHKLIDMEIQYVPQKNELFDDATVMENLQYSLLHLGNRKESLRRIDAESQRRIDEVMIQFPILKDRCRQIAGRLSGGERKLLTLAMVLVNRPTLLLYDEPLAGISEDYVPSVLTCLEKIHKNGTTIVIVEHRISSLLPFANRVIGLKFGHLYTKHLKTMEEINSFII